MRLKCSWKKDDGVETLAGLRRVRRACYPNRLRHVCVALVISAAKSALSTAGPARSVEVSILLTNDDEIRALNQNYRDKDMPTNVLSFAISNSSTPSHLSSAQPTDLPKLLGDVVVAYETCSKEASAQSRLMEDYLCHMIIHGTLHLLGHDHDNEEEAIIMENFERKSLTPLGITDPYINICK